MTCQNYKKGNKDKKITKFYFFERDKKLRKNVISGMFKMAKLI